ncbi:MAG: SDR family oxidoreductase [Candidatus Sumerlaeota bacterium]|nr:SDR family oxidoreductase [Candidatus Sumerlaeota bacterium]
MKKSVIDMFDLKGRTAIVTGGYGHLGKSLTMALAEAGCSVFVADLDQKSFKRVFTPKKVLDIRFVSIDISSTNSIRRAFSSVAKKTGRIDVLVNNAFYTASDLPEKMNDEQWERGIDGTLSSVFRCIREVIPFMKKRRSGSIVNIASMYGLVAPTFHVYDDHPQFLNPPNYGSAKAGVIQLTKYYASYCAPWGIRVNAIVPGAFPSKIVKKEKLFISRLEKQIPIGRVGNSDELKGALVLLASDASSYITGHNLIVDGGWTIR